MSASFRQAAAEASADGTGTPDRSPPSTALLQLRLALAHGQQKRRQRLGVGVRDQLKAVRKHRAQRQLGSVERPWPGGHLKGQVEAVVIQPRRAARDRVALHAIKPMRSGSAASPDAG